MTEYRQPHDASWTKQLFLTAVFATMVYALVFFLFVTVLAGAFTLVTAVTSGVALPLQPSHRLITSVIFAAPVTLILLPMTAIAGWQHPALPYVFPLVGPIFGILAMQFWSLLRNNVYYVKTHLSLAPIGTDNFTGSGWLFIAAISGLAAGGVFSAAIARIRR